MDILYYAKDREPDWEEFPVKELKDEICENFDHRAKRLSIDYSCIIKSDVKSPFLKEQFPSVER